jgi:hypothetical protein
MPSRRRFLQSTIAAAAGVSGASVLNPGKAFASSAASREKSAPKPAAAVQVPKMKFFHVEISRLVLGVNPFCGFAHYNNNYSGAMKEWYTPDRVCAVMHQCSRFGINAFNYAHYDPFPQDWQRFQAEGGKMHLIMQVLNDDQGTAESARNFKPLAMHRQGEVVDQAFQAGKMDTVHEWCKKVRDMEIIVGVGTHKPEVI